MCFARWCLKYSFLFFFLPLSVSLSLSLSLALSLSPASPFVDDPSQLPPKDGDQGQDGRGYGQYH